MADRTENQENEGDQTEEGDQDERQENTPARPFTPPQNTPPRANVAVPTGLGPYRNSVTVPRASASNRSVLVDISSDGKTRLPWTLCNNCQRPLSAPGIIVDRHRVGCGQNCCQSGLVRCPGERGEGGCKQSRTTRNNPNAPICSICDGIGMVIHRACRGGQEIIERCEGDSRNGAHSELWFDIYDRDTIRGMSNEFQIYEDPEEKAKWAAEEQQQKKQDGKGKGKRLFEDDDDPFL